MGRNLDKIAVESLSILRVLYRSTARPTGWPRSIVQFFPSCSSLHLQVNHRNSPRSLPSLLLKHGRMMCMTCTCTSLLVNDNDPCGVIKRRDGAERRVLSLGDLHVLE